MKVYSYSQARQNLSQVLNESVSGDVLIRRRGGKIFRVSAEKPTGSPFAVKGIKTKATTADIMQAVRDVRKR